MKQLYFLLLSLIASCSSYASHKRPTLSLSFADGSKLEFTGKSQISAAIDFFEKKLECEDQGGFSSDLNVLLEGKAVDNNTARRNLINSIKILKDAAREMPDDTSPSVLATGGMVDVVKETLESTRKSHKHCSSCGTESNTSSPLLRCSRCRTALYCNQACQIADRKKHKKNCKSKKK